MHIKNKLHLTLADTALALPYAFLLQRPRGLPACCGCGSGKIHGFSGKEYKLRKEVCCSNSKFITKPPACTRHWPVAAPIPRATDTHLSPAPRDPAVLAHGTPASQRSSLLATLLLTAILTCSQTRPRPSPSTPPAHLRPRSRPSHISSHGHQII